MFGRGRGLEIGSLQRREWRLYRRFGLSSCWGAAGAQAATGGGRVLTASDVVAIRIVDHPDLDWTARVEPDGTINFPYVGEINPSITSG